MKKKRFGLVAMLAVALLGLTACNDFGSPKGVVKTSASALKENDSELFFKTLTGDALQQYGSEEGMVILQKELGEFLKVRIGSVTLTSHQQGENGKDVLRTYQVEVLGRKFENSDPVNLLNAQVTCKVTYTWDPPHPKRPGSGRWIERMKCQIYQLD